MELEIEIISNELIKPSTPTLSHPKSYKLSLLDQFFTLYEYGTPMAFFFDAPPRDDDNVVVPCNDISTLLVDRLKESLSKALSFYYPLAGRLMFHESAILCNDEGCPLVVARAKCCLSDFLQAPNRVDLVHLFNPKDQIFLDRNDTEVKGLVPLAIQINVFDCGGFAIGSHALDTIIDGTSWGCFMNTWAAISASGGRTDFVTPPDFTSAVSLFPPVTSHKLSPSIFPGVIQPLEGVAALENTSACIVKVFEFSPQSIASLQHKARSNAVCNPTRVESVTCFLWKHLMASATTLLSSRSHATEEPLDDDEDENVCNTMCHSAIIHSVNMRPHLRPPLPPTSYGNIVTHAYVYCENNQTMADLVVVLREAFSKTKDIEFLNKFQGATGADEAQLHKQKLGELYNNGYYFASWKGLEVLDYGSGKPLWICLTGGRLSYGFRNFIPLIHTRNQGIEAWMILDEQQMLILESDSDFLAFASPVGAASPM